ncbi:ABC transporter ATP-binding protein [Sphaerothrix gracilis]|uniref:ABC transporter ATP-binding protein n=1 Tax=Sphaerothrix gracilis TaxID=3151835 RepID=UPI0031FC6FD7
MTLDLPSFPTTHSELNLPSAAIALEAHHLRKGYGRGKKRFEAVRDVSLTIHAGEVLAFLGPNGAGKTTTIKMIAGLIRPDSGSVRIAGLDPHQQARALKQVGAVLEGNRNLYWKLTALENLDYFGVLRGLSSRLARQRGADLLDQFDLADKRHTPVQKLSRGMQQKLAIAVALIHQPRLLLLDEPTLGLDVEAGETVKALVRQIAQSGCAILLTTHQLDVAEELSDRVAVIRQGQIITEKPTQELIRQFSGSTYRITFEGDLTASQQQAIAALGATIHLDHLTFAGEPAQLYSLLNLIQPLPLLEVTQDKADLTQVFLKLIRDR